MSVDYYSCHGYLLPLKIVEAAVRETANYASMLLKLPENLEDLTDLDREEFVMHRAIDELLEWCGFDNRWREGDGEGSRWEHHYHAGSGARFYPNYGGDGCATFKNYSFDLYGEYLSFDSEDLFVQIRDGRQTIIKPTLAYDRLCEFLKIPEIERFDWVLISW